jgi:hypothetical protein
MFLDFRQHGQETLFCETASSHRGFVEDSSLPGSVHPTVQYSVIPPTNWIFYLLNGVVHIHRRTDVLMGVIGLKR